MNILELIPENVLLKIKAEEEINFSKIEKNFYKMNLENKVKNIFKKFSNLDYLTFLIELDIIENYENFIITNSDIEAKNYGISPIVGKNLEEDINSLEFMEIFPLFLTIRTLFFFYRNNLSKKRHIKILKLLKLLRKENIILKEVCYYKNISNYNKMVNVEKQMEYLKIFLNALK